MAPDAPLWLNALGAALATMIGQHWAVRRKRASELRLAHPDKVWMARLGLWLGLRLRQYRRL